MKIAREELFMILSINDFVKTPLGCSSEVTLASAGGKNSLAAFFPRPQLVNESETVF
jgi:hypothetical protein